MARQDDRQASQVGLPAGTKIGKYEIRERLGMGGQAVVYKAHDPLLDRYVAIKQISTHLAEDPKFLERFRREAQILAKLGPEVITIHELVEDERGLFIVMEYVEGHTLETILRESEGSQDPKVVLQILWRLAATLHEVHSAGIVHRDLKPSNIIVTEDVRPHITDFGVAASAAGQTSMLLGTTKYMAPEMYAEGTTPDARADIYSLGFIIYELLLGRAAFNEIFQDVVRDPHSEALRWMKWHGNEKVTAPPAHKVNPDVPPELSEIVARMIAKDPADRFASMEELGRAIKQRFSAKGRSAAAAAAAGSLAPSAPARAIARAAATADKGAAPAAAAAESQAPAEAEGPETAPLPKASLSRRTKLILAGVIAASLVGIVIILVVEMGRIGAEQEKAAAELHKEAEQLLDQRKYAEAVAKLEDLRTAAHKGTVAAAKARVDLPLARALLAMDQAADKGRSESADALWNKVATQFKAVRDALASVAEDRPRLGEWVAGREGRLERLEKLRTHLMVYVRDVRTIRALMAEGSYAEALQRMQHPRDEVEKFALQVEEAGAFAEGAARLEAHRAELDALQRQAERKQFMQQTDQRLAQAAQLANSVNLPDLEQALVTYQRLADRLAEAPRALFADTPDADYLDRLAQRIAEGRQEARERKAYLEAKTEAAAAADDHTKLEALERALEHAKKVEPQAVVDDLTAKIQELRAQIWFEQGQRIERRLAGEKDLKKRQRLREQAKRQYEHAVDLTGHAQARAALAALERQERRDALIAEGDAARQAGQYEDALAKYKKAAELGSSEELSQKTLDVRFLIPFTKAQRLRQQKKYDEAEKEFQNAMQVKPSERPRIEALIAEIRQQERFERYMEAGDAALARGNYADAKENFQKARGTQVNEEEALARLAEVDYRENLAKGKREQARGNLKMAWGWYNLAQKAKDTEEVQRLIREVKKALGEGQEDSS